MDNHDAPRAIVDFTHTTGPITLYDRLRIHPRPDDEQGVRVETISMSAIAHDAPTIDGPALRAWREARGISQRELAGRLGTIPNTIAKWERGEQGIRHPRILALALETLDTRLKRSSPRKHDP